MNTIWASELRVGNFISDIHASDSFFAPVIELRKTRCYYGLFHSVYADLRPIPLNEDWLVRFSFEKAGIRFSKDWFYLWEQDDKIIFALAEMKEITGTYLEIKYVHQLQNLYFALTGTELTLTDK